MQIQEANITKHMLGAANASGMLFAACWKTLVPVFIQGCLCRVHHGTHQVWLLGHELCALLSYALIPSRLLEGLGFLDHKVQSTGCT